MPRGIKNRADAWEVRPIRKAPYVTAPMDYLDVSVEAKSEAMQSMADAPGSRCWKAAGAMSLLERCGLA